MNIFEIIPDKLYQSRPPEDAAEWQHVLALKIDVVLDLFGTLDPDVPTAPNSILYMFWPIEDQPQLPDVQVMNVLVDTIVRLIQLGHKVLVHCHKGKSRSGMINALVVRQLKGCSGADAVDLVRKHRPGALGNQVFAAYVRDQPAPAAPAAPLTNGGAPRKGARRRVRLPGRAR